MDLGISSNVTYRLLKTNNVFKCLPIVDNTQTVTFITDGSRTILAITGSEVNLNNILGENNCKLFNTVYGFNIQLNEIMDIIRDIQKRGNMLICCF